jgi:hypothetical protein
MSVQERLTNGNGFRILIQNEDENRYYQTYEENDPEIEGSRNKLPVNAIYCPVDVKFLELGYWEPLYDTDGDGNVFLEGWYYRNYMREWAGDDIQGNTQVLGGFMEDVDKIGNVVKAGTWLYAPQGHPFDFVMLKKGEKPYVILY